VDRHCEFEAAAWDRQFEADVIAGRLDAAAERARDDRAAGRSKRLRSDGSDGPLQSHELPEVSLIPIEVASRIRSGTELSLIAYQILASLADEDAWKKRFAEKRDVIQRMAREALEEDERGEMLALDATL